MLIRVIFRYIKFKQLFSDNYSLDGKNKEKKYKVIRKDTHNSQDKYSYINNNEILPGDVLLLKENDIIPCDGDILEGECILSVNNLL
jgi:P-type E1-E2 ATPase